MKDNSNRIIYRDGKKWINHRIDGRGPDTSHNKLDLAIQRATLSIQKHGDGQLKVKDESDDTLINTLIKQVRTEFKINQD
jgi:hypothetical protein